MNKEKICLLSVRVILAVLILVNLFFIFRFSLQNATESSATSGQVSGVVADIVVDDYDKKDDAEKKTIRNQIDPVVRKIAHMSEFGLLGTLVFLLMLTWRWSLWLQYLIALGATLLTACIDELLQNFSDGRAMQFTDVLADLLGGVISCTLILAALVIVRSIKRKKGAF